MPQEDANWDPAAVWKELRYRTTEQWLDDDGEPFLPYTHYGVGGNSKFWGSVLYRLRREDFGAAAARRRRVAGVADRLRHAGAVLRPGRAAVSRARRRRATIPPSRRARPYPYPPVPHAPRMAAIVEQLRALGLHPSSLPLGLIRPGEAGGCQLCNTCNSFPCRVHAKSDADVLCVRPALAQPNVTLWTGALRRRGW